MSILKLSNVNTGYGKKQVLHDVSLEVEDGDLLLVVGPNGSGKSTLLKVIYGLLDVWDGTIEFEGSLLHNKFHKTDVHKLLEKRIMYVPQKDALFDNMSVEENLQTSLLHLNNISEINFRVNTVLKEMPDLEKIKKREAGRLSGGERKMLSFAMVIANRPRLLLYDEPIAGVSEENISIVKQWIQRIREEGCSFIIVEHRIKEFTFLANHIFGAKLGHFYLNTEENL